MRRRRPEHYAFLYDCVRMADGKDQLYGSQFVRSVDGDTVVPWPIEDPEHVDARRARLGLPPLAEHAATCARSIPARRACSAIRPLAGARRRLARQQYQAATER